ncbi:pyruvate, water dikinase regulatory protein [Paralimibaculum aggregatum]|uniref:Pyruvate, water dikinase regulatory protein n=1 Tax=Paralimibaculum aggregatum TaxID=3036245 RepID=A0ABQ6LQL7_9RHOB|nr:pyruvate, water dikinase regulatory protein [Limibaculum sp. NKW23]GMG83438.1 pyruvate, water dikinase regulatory protein [Limibaculum sp. NKW23]
MPHSRQHTIHLVSDSTGETLAALARACLAPFGNVSVELEVTVFVRTEADLDRAIARLRARPGLMCYTLAERSFRNRLEAACASLGVPAIAPLDPLIARLGEAFGRAPSSGVGLQHQIDRSYFERIAAIDFAMAHDDGALGTRLMQADVILTGVSRTSKTPTSLYLANRGIKAANVPLVPGRELDPAFFKALESGIPAIGLTASPLRLAQIRGERLEALGDTPADYADLDRIQAEVADARLFFERHAIPVIDVTRRSIEETAAAIQMTLRQRDEAAGDDPAEATEECP